jgi:flagellar export protein FliJ
MKERQFKFRAQVVLDLRQRTDEEAQRARAAADAAVRQAELAVDEARARLLEAGERAQQPGASGGDAEWYRNWMVGLRVAVARRTEDLARRRADREVALSRALAARRDLRAIERLRDRRRRAFELEGRRQEQRQIDALAVQQFTSPSRDPGGFS